MATRSKSKSRSKRREGAEAIPITQGPWKGMRTALAETAASQGYAHYIENLCSTDPARGGELQPRPGHRVVGGVDTSAIRCFAQFDKADGTRITVMIAAGVLYELRAIPGLVWTARVNAAAFVTASIALLGGTTPYFTCVTANRLVVSDGVNPPWMWDGTTNGGLTSLTDCPALYGVPVEYYGKLFGIKAEDRRTIVWSEENDPEGGYQASGFDNAWTLAQSGDEPLVALCGTNEGLFYWRPHSVGVIRGAVFDEFRTTGVLDGVSTGVGTTYPAGVCLVGQDIWFVDASRRVFVIVAGEGVHDVSPAVSALGSTTGVIGSEPFGLGVEVSTQSTFSALTPNASRVIAVGPTAVHPRRQVWVSMPKPGELPNVALVFDAETRLPQAWFVFPVAEGDTSGGGGLANLASVRDPVTTAPVAIFGAHDTDPKIMHSTALSDDTTQAQNTHPVAGMLIGQPIEVSTALELHADRLDLVVVALPETELTVEASVITSAKNTTPELDPSQSQTLAAGATRRTERLTFGLDQVGRWFRPSVVVLAGGLASLTLHVRAIGRGHDAH